MKRIMLFMLFLLISWHSLVLGQFENGWVCGMEEEQQGNVTKSPAGHQLDFIEPLPTYNGINFKVAVLYFKDADDNFTLGGDCRVNSWPITSDGPEWMGELLIPTEFNAETFDADTAARPYSITTHFYHLSGGNIWIYGDEYAYPHTTVLNTPINATEWRNHNQAVHEWFIDNHDLTDLDNDGDGVVDMIIFLNRAGYNPGYQGIAEGDYLPSPIDITGAPGEPEIWGRVINNWTRNSGVFARNIYDLLDTFVFLHEIGHQLHQLRGHFNGLHRWNLMSGVGANPPTLSGIVMSAWERMELGWLTFTNITDDQLNYELADVSSSGETVRIPVGVNDYFLIELRRNNDRFESRENCGVSTGLPEGLLISYSINNNEPTIRPADGTVTLINGLYRDGDETDLFPNGGITKITPYTTPNTADRNGNRTGLAILNIQHSGAGNEKVRFDVRQNYWEGAITSNTTWSGQVYVGENVTVNNGVTLTISAGTTVLFASGKKLTVNGSIQANGASGNPITFDRSGASGTWAGIWIENSTASSNLNYCTLRHTTYGLRIKNSSGMVTIDHATLTDNSFGLLAENSSPFTIQNSTIQDNAYGVYIVSSSGSGSMKILSNNISSNSNHGVYLYNNADAFLGFNTITGNTQHGIYCYSNSDATIRSILPSPDYGGNIIHSNGGDGVRTAGTSYPSLGVGFQQGGIKDYYGYNEIQDNDGDEVGNSNASGTIMAERNYWSSNHEVEAEPEDLNGSVDYDPVLPEIPTMPSQQPFNTLTKTLIDFKEAYALENRDELQAAAELYVKLLHENPEADNVGFGVSGLIRCYKGLGRHAEINRLMDDLIDDFKGTALAGSASSHSLPFLVQIGDFGIAISRATELLQKNRESAADEAHYLFQLGSIYHLKSGNTETTDLTNALGYYDELLQKHPDSDFALLATLEKEQLNRDGLARPAIGISRPLVPASSFTLYPNYPNPFNPETRIGFHLDNEKRVSLRIYDVNGRLIKTLVDGFYQTGDHEMTWNGRDSRGVAMASGVYFLELVAGNERQMRKMIVVH